MKTMNFKLHEYKYPNKDSTNFPDISDEILDNQVKKFKGFVKEAIEIFEKASYFKESLEKLKKFYENDDFEKNYKKALINLRDGYETINHYDFRADHFFFYR
jgi:hypothetical protein